MRVAEVAGEHVWHRPSAGGASVLMLEPTGTLGTGDHEGAVPGHVDATTGSALR